MSEAHGQHHPYHLVDPSPWPLIGAFSGGVLATGMVLFMHEITPWLLPVGILLVLTTMFGWWSQVVHEARVGLHTPIVRIGLRYGMLLFIASEVMFFVAFFWAYFDASLFPDEVKQFLRTQITGGVWPPTSIHTFDPFALPFLNTLILLLSGCTVTWAHHALREGDRRGMIQGLGLTIILGLMFTSFQAFEYSHAAFSFRENIYSSTFFMATGFHGFHVIVGTIFLTVCFFRALRGDFTPERHVGFEAAAWYWHFVDVVWLFLFTCVYWYGAGVPAVE
ncbi:cytochrome c oxidase subunit 3 [Tistlia consotensis]|uniref:Cytochrome c oxidase subunit 3 n=1 Tax=Tistlia consotensis USBA 355 TaxID=560819 RepID=A0A1Y6B6G9_9PROT|nr:cytochrome c oxidase subunit 3 [Tistlia consotensis]SME94680.1 cytochrome c oxidase subunit 3 [Tistlia consotensis USBA 355]SNR29478.1 cytochrome c oxidase subunit 3 [Tistlia consotensis]